MAEVVDVHAELRRLADRAEIVELFNRFAYAADARDWETLRTRVYASDIVLDHTQGGDPDPSIDTVTTGLDAVMDLVSWGTERHLATHHMITNHQIELRGDEATVVASLHSVHADPNDDGRQTVQIQQGRYFTELTRTADGWRIRRMKPSVWKALLLPIAQPLAQAELDDRRRELRAARRR